MAIIKKINEAIQILEPYCLKTALLHSIHLQGGLPLSVYLKMESEQYTGSFKFRGALHKLMRLRLSEKKRGVITASTGNHAQGVALACQITKTNGTIFLPHNVTKSKYEALKQYPVELRMAGESSLETELIAKKTATESKSTWVSPYNDMDIIAGQGTIASELLKQINKIDQIFITVGGGGLISGIASYLKQYSPGTKIIACQPENSPEMFQSVLDGKIIQENISKPTLSDGSAGGIESGSITFPICQKLIDDFILVSENDIKNAIRLMAKFHNKIVEGAAAVAIASYLKSRNKYLNTTSVVVVCGGNIDFSKFKSIIC